jgi:hypothetical protein
MIFFCHLAMWRVHLFLALQSLSVGIWYEFCMPSAILETSILGACVPSQVLLALGVLGGMVHVRQLAIVPCKRRK